VQIVGDHSTADTVDACLPRRLGSLSGQQLRGCVVTVKSLISIICRRNYAGIVGGLLTGAKSGRVVGSR
jgi:hypothetical protein